jgi:biotin-dependent carboxylase-like uncharacterized protein
MSLEVLKPDFLSRVVDLGRPGTRSLGVPVGGAADRAALALGNALVGNPADAAALELCLGGPWLRAVEDTACVVYGAPFVLSSAHQNLWAGKTFTLRAGEELEIHPTQQGVRAYFCVRGGLQTPVVLGSRSAPQSPKRGEILPCVRATIQARYSRQIVPRFADRYVLRVLPGLQASWFRADEFHDQDFTVRPESNRMGLRLLGVPLAIPERELVSEPVAPGAVQVTRDGQCIVLGVDGQTIGGYPKVAHVIEADLDRLGQIRPGDRIRFEQVSLAAATNLFREQQALLRRCVLRLQVGA